MLVPSEQRARGPAEQERYRHRYQAIGKRPSLCRGGHEPLEAELLDPDFAGRTRDHPTILDQERLRGIIAHRHARRYDDMGPIEHAIGDLDATRVFQVKLRTLLEIDQPRLESPLLVWTGAGAGRQLEVLQTKFVDGGGALVD